jgi:tRNA threonylcarbamoyladenosine biosynthesis protein TsaE
MNSLTFTSENEAATNRLGAALADVLPEGTTVALCGTLGAGKTRLVKAIAGALGVDPAEVISPTFVICREYHGRRTIYHLDAYRIADDDEFLELGPEEYYESDGITLIEWADRVEACLPPDRIEIEIEVTGETERTFQIKALGDEYASVLDSLVV